jgi:septum formation protein
LKKRRLILGSSSPRRRELLSPYFKLKIISAGIDENVRRGESASSYVKRLAREKWESISNKILKKHFGEVLIAADTTVAMGKRIFSKANNKQEASRMLKAYSGKSHHVLTAVALGRVGKRRPKLILVRTMVRFRKLDRQEIQFYLSSSEWRGKAGAYAIQGLAGGFVSEVRGSLSNVIGLPLAETIEALKKL